MSGRYKFRVIGDLIVRKRLDQYKYENLYEYRSIMEQGDMILYIEPYAFIQAGESTRAAFFGLLLYPKGFIYFPQEMNFPQLYHTLNA